MNSVSANGENIRINFGKTYFVIDGVYLEMINEIIDAIKDLEKRRFEDEVKEKAFPYNDIPFAKFKALRDVFTKEDIQEISHEDVTEQVIAKCFACDSAIVLFIEEDSFVSFCKAFNYDDLLSSEIELLNLEYWQSLEQKFEKNDIGLLVTEGGSGIYKILM